VGVRRQGFTALVPQSIESVKEIQIVTSLWDAEAGRSSGSQVNAVSRSGSNRVHGTLYDFFNHDALNARNFFDYDSGGAPAKPLTATFSRSFINGQPQAIETLPVYLGKTTPILQANPSGAENPFQRSIAGGAAGFPLWRDRTFFFGSFERQDVKAEQETHFAVPTIAQRGFLGFGATGLAVTTAQRVRHYYPTTFAVTPRSRFSRFQ
jgi:hypothetical protein